MFINKLFKFLQVGYCYINGKCYGDGSIYEIEECIVCNIEKNIIEWSKVDGQVMLYVLKYG